MTGRNARGTEADDGFRPVAGEELAQIHKGSLRRVRFDLFLGGIAILVVGIFLPWISADVTGQNYFTYGGIALIGLGILFSLLGKKYRLYVTTRRLVLEWVSAWGRRIRIEDYHYDFFESIAVGGMGVGTKQSMIVSLSSGKNLAFSLPRDVAEAILVESRGFLSRA